MLKISKKKGAASRPLMRLALALTAIPILAGCQTLTGATNLRVVDTSCQAFRPITYSSRDTAETQREVRGHNAAWDALCKPTPAAESDR